MALIVSCPACERDHKVPERAAGKKFACLNCGAPIAVPKPKTDDPPPTPQSEEPSRPKKKPATRPVDDEPELEPIVVDDDDAPRPKKKPATRPVDDEPELEPIVVDDDDAPRPKKKPATRPVDDEPELEPIIVDDEPEPADQKRRKKARRDSEPEPELDEEEPRKKTKRDSEIRTPLKPDGPPLWRRHLHWLLVLALIPLIVTLTSRPDERTAQDRLKKGLEKLNSDQRDPSAGNRDPETEADINLDDEGDPLPGDIEIKNERDLVLLLPGQRLEGAFLSRKSKAHWVLALATAALYMSFFMFMASDGSARPLRVLLVGLFTATIGIFFLLAVQVVAAVAIKFRLRIGGVIGIFILLLKLIAFSYYAALNPEYGFIISFLGFTFGVGLCEEVVECAPLFWHRSTVEGRSWRGIMIWGLASGAGFGIAEGVIYSYQQYNGLAGPDIYLVRFISCVALHAIWTGSVAIMLFLWRDLFDSLGAWYDWIWASALVVSVPAILHGLYDTALKRDMNGLALGVALVSFGYLAFLLSRLQSNDDRRAARALRRKAKRRRKARAIEEES